MTSDTPRTEAARGQYTYEFWSKAGHAISENNRPGWPDYVPASFARELELELAVATKFIIEYHNRDEIGLIEKKRARNALDTLKAMRRAYDAGVAPKVDEEANK